MTEHADRFDPREYIPNLPRRPGVYRMYSESGELLYVGKARSLRDRVGNYFLASNVDPKVQALIGHIARIEVTLTTSETEALAAKLRRQVSSSARAELERLGPSLKTPDVPSLTRDLQVTGLRAGFIACGELRVALEQLAAHKSVGVTDIVSDALGRDLIGFALSDAVARLLSSGDLS